MPAVCRQQVSTAAEPSCVDSESLLAALHHFMINKYVKHQLAAVSLDIIRVMPEWLRHISFLQKDCFTNLR